MCVGFTVAEFIEKASGSTQSCSESLIYKELQLAWHEGACTAPSVGCSCSQTALHAREEMCNLGFQNGGLCAKRSNHRIGLWVGGSLCFMSTAVGASQIMEKGDAERHFPDAWGNAARGRDLLKGVTYYGV